jgi:hypothetical protein
MAKARGVRNRRIIVTSELREDVDIRKLVKVLLALSRQLSCEDELLKGVETEQAGGARKDSADSPGCRRGHTNSDIRRWANDQGIKIGARGKIAREVYDQFIAAHPGAKPEA